MIFSRKYKRIESFPNFHEENIILVPKPENILQEHTNIIYMDTKIIIKILGRKQKKKEEEIANYWK